VEVWRLLSTCQGRRQGVEATVKVSRLLSRCGSCCGVSRLLSRCRGRCRSVEAAVEVFKAAVEVFKAAVKVSRLLSKH
jgi:hypothetical protein